MASLSAFAIGVGQATAPSGGGMPFLWGWFLILVAVVFLAAIASSVYYPRPPARRR